jgi:hypothetical protein
MGLGSTHGDEKRVPKFRACQIGYAATFDGVLWRDQHPSFRAAIMSALIFLESPREEYEIWTRRSMY